MPRPFKGIINIDIRDSTPDWEPYEQPKAPEGSPNVLFIVWDDTGFGALSPFGGPIETPTMDRLADGGLALHAVPHDGAVLADSRVDVDRSQPHHRRHGVHLRGDDRVPRLERSHPVRDGDDRRGARRAWLQHVHVGQVALLPGGRDEHGVDEAELADRPRLRALLRLPRRRDQPVVSRPGPGPAVRRPALRPARRTGRRAWATTTTCPRTSSIAPSG